MEFCRKFPGGTGISHCRHNEKGYFLMKVLKTLASKVPIYSFFVILLSKITPVYKWMFLPFDIRSKSGGLILWEK
jgi:hypothetical protein